MYHTPKQILKQNTKQWKMFWPPIDTNNLSQSELHESRGGTGIRWNLYDERIPSFAID